MGLTADEFTGRSFGAYEVLCRLTIGGMAELFLGFGRSGRFIGRPVVLKRILPEQRDDPTALDLLLNEARLTSTLNHPNVAKVIDLVRDEDEVLLVIEHIAGANLEEVAGAYAARGEAVPLGFALSAAREIALGVGHAHAHVDARGQPQPIVHRDVTPRNVMVDFDGAFKVLDFGIARARGTSRRTQVGMVRGTTAYMSPEQVVGQAVDQRTDLFSLGIVLHELLTGKRLFFRGNASKEMAAVYEQEIVPPSRLAPRLPRQLDAVVMRALERDLERRYQSVAEFVRDLTLAAGSGLWPRDRCADVVRQHFAVRKQELDRLFARIPRRASPSREAMPAAPLDVEDEAGVQTVVSLAPLSGRAPSPARAASREPVADRATDPRSTLPVDPQSGAWEVPTRILEGSLRAPPSVAELPTDPRRVPLPPARAWGRRRALALAAAVAVLALGAVAWRFAWRWATAPAVALGRLSIASDRPVDVLLDGQSLGVTPAGGFVPAGHHALRLQEVDGRVRALEVDVRAGEETRLQLTLDALPLQP
jgi:serine/threonine protein kinase